MRQLVCNGVDGKWEKEKHALMLIGRSKRCKPYGISEERFKMDIRCRALMISQV